MVERFAEGRGTVLVYVVISRVRAWGKLPHAVKKIIAQRGKPF